jgi:ElaA protein
LTTFQIKTFQELSIDELYELMQLRVDVFVVEQNCPYPELDGLDQEAIHVLGYGQEGNLIAYSRILAAGVKFKEVSPGRIIVHPEYRGGEVGRLLIEKTLEVISQTYGNVPVKIAAQQPLSTYYGNFGFEICSSPYLEDGIPHVDMVREK